MNKITQLCNLFSLIVIPIIANIVFLIVFPFFALQSIFTDDDDFHSGIEKYYKALAKLNK